MVHILLLLLLFCTNGCFVKEDYSGVIWKVEVCITEDSDKSTGGLYDCIRDSFTIAKTSVDQGLEVAVAGLKVQGDEETGIWSSATSRTASTCSSVSGARAEPAASQPRQSAPRTSTEVSRTT